MKLMSRRICALIASAALALSTSAVSYANSAVYDPGGISGPGFSLGDDQVSIRTRIYPGDSIAGTAVYVGDERYNAGQAEEINNLLDDGTPCWTNYSSTVYSVTDVSGHEQVQMVNEAGEPVYDEAGEPVMTDMVIPAYLLRAEKYILEVAGGTASVDDPSLKDTEYAPEGDVTYFFTDAGGASASFPAYAADAAAYPFGTTVYLTADAPADPSLEFQGWKAYRVGDGGSELSELSADQLPSFGIAGADSLSAAAVAENGGRLAVRADGPAAHVVFIPYYAPAAQPQEEIPEEPAPDTAGGEWDVQQDIPAELPVEPAADGQQEITPEGAGFAEGAGTDVPGAVMDENGVLQIGEPAPAFAYTVSISSVDPTLMAPADSTTSYAGGDFYQTISTAETLGDGQVFAGWTAEPEGIVSFEDASAASTGFWFNDPSAPAADQSVQIRANYAAPAPAVYALGLENAYTEYEDTSALTAGTQLIVYANDRSGENLVFTGWAAEGIELDADQAASPQLDIVMPENPVYLAAQYQERQTEPPTEAPTEQPTEAPTEQPTEAPTEQPTEAPTEKPTEAPTEQPTEKPTEAPTEKPTEAPTEQPTEAPTEKPTEAPTEQPTEKPTEAPAPETASEAEGQQAETQPAETQPETVPLESETEKKQDQAAAHAVTQGEGSAAVTVKQGETPVALPGSADAEAVLTVSTAQQPHAAVQWTVTDTTNNVAVAVANAAAWTTTFTMPDGDVSVKAVVTPEQTYTLTVNSGTGSGTFYNGDVVSISANAPAEGYRFSGWSLASGTGTFANAASSTTNFTMAAGNAAVTANYELIPYTLTVKNGKGGGSYTMGTSVDISPNFPASGKEFDSWEVTSGKITFDDSEEYYATVTMKASDAAVKATYKDGPNPADNKITGLENNAEYLRSTTLSFTAAGAGMDNTDPNPGDYRYRPTGYQIGGVSGSWNSSPYTTSMAINAVGDYTLTVTYAKDVFDGNTWNADGTTVTKSITFHVVNALSVQTGDSSPLIPLAIAGGCALAAIIALVVVLRKRRKKN